MKLKSILKFEKETGESFFELSNKIGEGTYSMSDLVKMVWISKLDENLDAKLEDCLSDELELEEVLKELSVVLKND